MQNSESAKCSMCGRLRTSITDPESGELICGNCGMVITTNSRILQIRKDLHIPLNSLMTEQEKGSIRRYVLVPFRQGSCTVIGNQTMMLLERNLKITCVRLLQD